MLAFHRALYVGYQREVVPPELEATFSYVDLEQVLETDVDTLLADPGRQLLLAELDGRPAGYVTGHVTEAPARSLPRRGVVEDWYVAPEARGRGVGTALMEALLARFRALGCDLVESRTWADNEQGRAVHDRMGFRASLVTYRKRL